MSSPSPNPAHFHEPSSILKLLAGEFAAAVAALWPEPHLPFLTAPAVRRHLVCLALAHGRAAAPDLLTGRLRTALRTAVDDLPPGLERALSHIGEIAWDAEGYLTLAQLLRQARSAKALRHAEAISPEMVRRLAALPPAMGDAPHLALGLTAEGLLMLREAYDALRFRDGAAAAESAAGRWARVTTPKALFEAIRYDVMLEPLAPPHPGTARLKPLATKAEIWAAAKRYHNCLKDQMNFAASGWSTYYEWLGPPGAILEVTRDHVYGWVLDQARQDRNAVVPEAARDEIIADLALMGVHVGRRGHELDRLLNEDVGAGVRYWPEADAVPRRAFTD